MGRQGEIGIAREHAAAGEIPDLQAREIDGEAGGGLGMILALSVDFEAPAGGFEDSRGAGHEQWVPDAERASGQRSGDDAARALDRERSIDRQPQPLALRARRHRAGELCECSGELGDTSTIGGGRCDHGAGIETHRLERFPHVLFGERECLVIDEIGFGERDHHPLDAEQ